MARKLRPFSAHVHVPGHTSLGAIIYADKPSYHHEAVVWVMATVKADAHARLGELGITVPAANLKIQEYDTAGQLLREAGLLDKALQVVAYRGAQKGRPIAVVESDTDIPVHRGAWNYGSNFDGTLFVELD